MNNCKHCGREFTPNAIGAPRKYCGDVCKDRARYNTPKRKASRERINERRRKSGYHKARYKMDQEYQKARALKYYYENRDHILEQKRNHPGKAEAVGYALAKIRSGTATIDDAYDWMDQSLGFHSFEVESFITDMLDD
jgi:heterodisulfide reductase subunit B